MHLYYATGTHSQHTHTYLLLFLSLCASSWYCFLIQSCHGIVNVAPTSSRMSFPLVCIQKSMPACVHMSVHISMCEQLCFTQMSFKLLCYHSSIQDSRNAFNETKYLLFKNTCIHTIHAYTSIHTCMSHTYESDLIASEE